MLYSFLKIYVRAASFFFCRKIQINKPEILHISGPVLLACNHPNSFLDAVILDILFDQPLWSLARGDAFTSPRVTRIFTRLNILPVYRTSEGVENLSANYNTFDRCIEMFRKGGQVIIFSEARCINEWHLRPLRKGTARLASQAWQQGIPLKVLPVAINYSSFRRFGKNITINFGNIIEQQDFDLTLTDGHFNQAFNLALKKELEKGVFEIAKTDVARQKQLLYIKQPIVKKILLAIPALAGLLTHLPFYFGLKAIASRFQKSDHYDSILTGLLTFAYPFYLVLFLTTSWLLSGNSLAWLGLLLLPFCGWAAMSLKPQLDK